MTITDLMKEVDKQKIDFIVICKELDLDPGELGLFTSVFKPEFMMSLGMIIGILYEQKQQKTRKAVH
jgi:hypothetical protein